MVDKNYLVFDIGASNGRAIAAKFNGSIFDIEMVHWFENRPVFATDKLYWDILRLYSEIKIGIQHSVKKLKNISSIGIDTFSGDHGFLDSNGKLISNPVHHRDRERNDTLLANKFFDIIPRKELFFMTGSYLISGICAYHLFLLKIKKATELENADKFLMMPDIFNYFLTGRSINEFTNITTTTLYDQKEKKMSDKILTSIGISKDIFPGMVSPGDKIGNISDEVCKELEIGTIPVIAPATHDTASAVASIPVTDKIKEWAFISIGTWCVVGKETKIPVINEKAYEVDYVNEGGTEDTNILFKNLAGLWIIQKCRQKWIEDKGKEITWEEIVKLSSDSKPFQSFINVDEPIFYQPQIDMPEIVRKYCKEKGQYIPASIGEISRCIYESMVLKIRVNICQLEELTNKKIEILYLMGGGTKNKLLCKWIANVTGKPVIIVYTEATAVGNFLMQLKGSGEIKNLAEARQISLDSSRIKCFEPEKKDLWDQVYDRYLKIL